MRLEEWYLSIGTGKTLIGVQIAYWLAKRNAGQPRHEKKKQVLFCGPSNCSVDVVAGMTEYFAYLL